MKNLKHYAGIILLIAALIVPFSSFWIAGLGLPVAAKATIIGLVTVGVPEVLTLVAIALMGKEVYVALKDRLFSAFKKSSGTVGSVQ